MRKIRIFAVLLSLISLCSCASDKANTVAYVNGEGIENREFMLIASQKKAEVFKYFTDKYDAEYSETFWDSSFDGEKPSERISQLVMDELVPIKIQQKMAVEYGVLDSCNYSDFLKRLERENAERKKKKDNNQIVYGVTEYSEEAYYSDEFAKTILSLKDIWKQELDFGEGELKEYYETVKDMYYRQQPTGEVMLYIFDYSDSDKAASLLEKAKKGQLVGNEVTASGGRMKRLNIDENLSERYYDLQYPGLLQAVCAGDEYTGLLSMGDVIYFANAKNLIIGYKEYEDVKANVEKLYVDELYDNAIKKLVNEADVKLINQNLDFSDT